MVSQGLARAQAKKSACRLLDAPWCDNSVAARGEDAEAEAITSDGRYLGIIERDGYLAMACQIRRPVDK